MDTFDKLFNDMQALYSMLYTSGGLNNLCLKHGKDDQATIRRIVQVCYDITNDFGKQMDDIKDSEE